MSRIWLLVALAVGFVGGFGASVQLQKMQHRAPSDAAHNAVHTRTSQSAKTDHDHSRMIEIPAGAPIPTVDFALKPDPHGGFNLNIQTTNFSFSPESVNQPHVPGEGHAHVYVDGNKLARVYGPWFHIAKLPPPPFELHVTLNTNDHATLAVAGKAIAATKTIQGN